MSGGHDAVMSPSNTGNNEVHSSYLKNENSDKRTKIEPQGIPIMNIFYCSEFKNEIIKLDKHEY